MRPNKLYNLFSYSVSFFPRVYLTRKMKINTSLLNLPSFRPLAHPATAFRRAGKHYASRRAGAEDTGSRLWRPEHTNTGRLSGRGRARGGACVDGVLQRGEEGDGVKKREVREEGTKESRREQSHDLPWDTKDPCIKCLCISSLSKENVK